MNLITKLYQPDVATSTDDKLRVLKCIINGLTGIVCSSMMTHVFALRRGEMDEPTLDARNELDADARGAELKGDAMLDNGFTVHENPYRIAQIADGIRFELYKEMHRYDNFADSSALIRKPTQGLTEKINYNQPMSAQLYMEFRSRKPTTVNEREVKQLTTRRSSSVTEQQVREILLEDAIKSAARIEAITDEVMAEIESLEDVYDENTFEQLPIEVQVRFAENMQRSMQRDFERMLPRSLRDIEMAGECDLIELHLKALRAFVNEVEHEARLAA